VNTNASSAGTRPSRNVCFAAYCGYPSDLVKALRGLANLRDRGALTEDEYVTAKSLVLAGRGEVLARA
jgi:hypothetical protein